MTLANHNIQKLKEIKILLQQLPTGLYIKPKKLLSQSTIGQHFRHIIEFYTCLKHSTSTDTVCYDERDRELLIETNIKYATEVIETINLFLEKIKNDRQLTLNVSYSDTSDKKTSIQTSLFRELAYALDHTIHHLAIIKIALTEENLELDSKLGVAPSTIRHRKICVQ